MSAAQQSRKTDGSALLLAAVVLANLSATITYGAIGVITPSMAAALAVPVGRAIWVADALLIGIVCVTPLSAYLARRFDPRHVLIVSLAGLGLAAMAAAAAPSLFLLAAAMFVLGLFASPVAPVTQSLVASRFSPEERGRGMAWWTAGTLAGGLAGGTLGGPVAAQAGYAPALLLCLPFAAVTIALLVGRRNLLGPRPESMEGAGEPADLRGASLLIAATLSIGFVLNCADNIEGFLNPPMLLLLAIFAATAGGFAWHYRRTRNPILNLAVLRDSRFAAAALIMLGLNVVSTGQFEVDMLGTVLGFDADFLSLRAGLNGLGLLLGVAVAGFMVRRAPAAANLALAFMPLLLGRAGYLAYGGHVGWFEALWPTVAISVGYGMVASLLAAYAFDRVSQKLMAAATACFVFSRQVGSGLGLAGLDAVMKLAGPDRQGDAAGEASAFLLVFAIEFIGAALLCLLIPVFRRRRAAAAVQG